MLWQPACIARLDNGSVVITTRASRSNADQFNPAQNSALFGVRGNGITSLIFPMPVTNSTKRSSPSPLPACGTVPKP